MIVVKNNSGISILYTSHSFIYVEDLLKLKSDLNNVI